MDIVLGALLEATLTVARFGFRRASRDPRPKSYVQPSLWHIVGVVALIGQSAVILAAVVFIGRAALGVLNDDLLMFLGLILLPIALLGMALGLCMIGVIVGTARRLVARDAGARGEVLLAGVSGALLATWLAYDTGSTWSIALLAPAMSAVMVGCMPSAWIIDES